MPFGRGNLLIIIEMFFIWGVVTVSIDSYETGQA